MKRVVITSLLILSIFSGCSKNSYETEAEFVQIKPVKYTDSGHFWGEHPSFGEVPFDEIMGDITHWLEIDERVALDIANAVFRNIQGEDYIKDTEFSVYKSIEGNIIVVTRGPKGNDTDGGGISIAISTEDGSILKIWGGE